jgi:hypothetical protein
MTSLCRKGSKSITCLFLVQESKATLLVPTAPIDSTKFVAYVNERRKKPILFKGEYIVSIKFCLSILFFLDGTSLYRRTKM